MESKRYLNKVAESLVRGTNIDYEKGTIKTPYDNIYTTDLVNHPSGSLTLLYMVYFGGRYGSDLSRKKFFMVVEYCVNHFGLTVDEIEYVWDIYIDIIKDKISNGK